MFKELSTQYRVARNVYLLTNKLKCERCLQILHIHDSLYGPKSFDYEPIKHSSL